MMDDHLQKAKYQLERGFTAEQPLANYYCLSAIAHSLIALVEHLEHVTTNRDGTTDRELAVFLTDLP